jgi:hypothetical protein
MATLNPCKQTSLHVMRAMRAIVMTYWTAPSQL